jgi:TolB-like protein
VKFLFEKYTLDTDRRELRLGSGSIPVQPQVFDLLVYLLQNRDRVVSKNDIVASVWNGRSVSESTLTSRINAARKSIGDSGDNQKLIRTIPRKGLRFVGAVEVKADGGRSPLLSQTSPEEAAEQTPLLLPDRPAIAVLPFTNMSDNPEQEYFSDGITEDIITALSKLRWFFVIARNSSFTYKGRAVHMKQVAEELGVRYVLEGSVRKSGEMVRITAQLNDVSTGSHIWAEHYDHHITDVFAVQDEITEAVVAAIEPQLYAAESFRARRKPPDSMDAWDLVMRALSSYWRVTRQDHLVAQALLEKAIAMDPNYCQALGLLADSYTFAAHMGWTDLVEAVRIAERAALAAIRADSEDPWGTSRAWRRIPDHPPVRRRISGIRVGTATQPEFFSRAELLCRGTDFLRSLGRRKPGRSPCNAPEPARSAVRTVLRLGLFGPVHWPKLRGSDAAGTRCRSPAKRLRRSPSRPDRRCRYGRRTRPNILRSSSGASPRSAQHLACLDRKPGAT